MPKQQVVNRQSSGLQQQMNPFQSPEGGLTVAANCTIDREGIISKRRGFAGLGFKMPSINSYLVGEYKNRLVLYDEDKPFLHIDQTGAGDWKTSGDELKGPPDDNNRVRGVEFRTNYYFTTSNGIYKVDQIADPVAAIKQGMPQGLDITLSSTNVSVSDWFTADTKVGYRVIYTREDANRFKVVGSPSFREEISNPTSSVVLDWAGSIVTANQDAHGFSTDDYIRISGASEATYDGLHKITTLDANHYYYSLRVEPSEKEDVTATAGIDNSVSITVTLPEDVVAGDFVEFYRTKLSASASTAPGDRLFRFLRKEVTSVDVTAGTITQIDTFDESFLDVELYTNPTQETILKANDRSPLLRDIAPFKGNLFGSHPTFPHSVETQLRSLTNMETATSTITVAGTMFTAATVEDAGSDEFLNSTAETTIAGNIEKTAKSLIRLVNRKSATSVYAFYISGINDAPGKILFKRRDNDGVSFTITSSEDIKDDFDPVLGTTGITSMAKTLPNCLVYAKFDEPDAMPASNTFVVGSEDVPIIRILNLRDSLIIMKEEGVWRLSGDTESDFVISEIDPSVRILAPETAVVLNNSVYCLSNQGAVKINENGTAIISRAVENKMMKAVDFTDFKTIAHGIAYDSEHKYILYLQNSSSSTVADRAWVYDFIIGVWTEWVYTANSGHVLRTTDDLFLSQPEFKLVFQQRNTDRDFEDYTDKQLIFSTIEITDKSGTIVNQFGETVSNVTLSYTDQEGTLLNGWLLQQSGDPLIRGIIVGIVDNDGGSYTVELDSLLEYENGDADLFERIDAQVEWVPEAADNQFVLKQFSEISIHMEKDLAKFHYLGFKSDVNPEVTGVRLVRDITAEDSITPIRVFVPNKHQRARNIIVNYRNFFAGDRFDITGMSLVFRPIGEKTTQAPI